jgi:hypothetical protein
MRERHLDQLVVEGEEVVVEVVEVRQPLVQGQRVLLWLSQTGSVSMHLAH